MEAMNNYLSQLSIDNMMRHLRVIASYERHAGTAQERLAFDYIRDTLQNLGCEVQYGTHAAYISIPQSATLAVNGRMIRTRTHSMSASTASGGIEGEVVYRDAIKPNESFEGKLIAMPGRAIYQKLAAGQAAGAIGMIFIQEEPVRECIPSAAWGSPTAEDMQYMPTIPLVSVAQSDWTEILDLASGQPLRAKLTATLDAGWRQIPTLMAEVKAPVATDKFVMLSGHVDSWYYGAIDNGTVNAMQLEIARIAIEQASSLKANLRIVFFSGHSQGRYAGSAWYADTHWLDLHNNCIVNVNADSIGGRGATDITRGAMMPETKPLAASIIKEQTGVDFVGTRYLRNADQSFWMAGVSSAFASFSKQPYLTGDNGKPTLGKGNSDLGWWWHTEDDTIEQVDPDVWLRDAKVFIAFLFTFLTSDVYPLDFRKTAQEISDALVTWQSKAGARFDLSDCLSLAKQLQTALQSFYDVNQDAEAKNDCLLRLGRLLVPLNFTTGCIYQNDPALNYPKVPALAEIDALVLTEEDSKRSYEILLSLQRKKNFVLHYLDQAVRLLQQH